MKKWMTIFSLSGVLTVSGAAYAQTMTAPPGDATVTATTTTTTTAGAPEAIGVEETGTLPTTGGAPLAMILGGTLTAAGALFLRRKLG